MKDGAAKPVKNPRVKNRKDGTREGEPKKVYKYNESNELPLYGVIVQWDAETKYTNKALQDKFDPKFETMRTSMEDANKSVVSVKSLKRKPFPFFRRVGPNKAIVMFGNMKQANEFVEQEDKQFKAFIPMSFVCTVGVATFNKFNFKLAELQEFFPVGYTVLQYRKKKLETGKIQVSIAVQGSKIPDVLNFKGDTIPFELLERKPVHCVRCLRYGHRSGDCMRKPRCGVCTPIKPGLTHREKHCGKIKRDPNIERCLYCRQGHTIATEGCIEHSQQREFKMKLVQHKMDYLSVLEKDILPAIRTTAVNSNRIWLD